MTIHFLSSRVDAQRTSLSRIRRSTTSKSSLESSMGSPSGVILQLRISVSVLCFGHPRTTGLTTTVNRLIGWAKEESANGVARWFTRFTK